MDKTPEYELKYGKEQVINTGDCAEELLYMVNFALHLNMHSVETEDKVAMTSFTYFIRRYVGFKLVL